MRQSNLALSSFYFITVRLAMCVNSHGGSLPMTKPAGCGRPQFRLIRRCSKRLDRRGFSC